MGTPYIVLAIPVFFLLIGLELLASALSKKPVLRLTDSIGSIGTGIAEQVVGASLSLALPFTLYVWVHEHFTLGWFADEKQPLTWIIAFVGVDLFYYWWHRLSHEVNFMWCAHVVHH